jgi:hypothetical protein
MGRNAGLLVIDNLQDNESLLGLGHLGDFTGWRRSRPQFASPTGRA